MDKTFGLRDEKKGILKLRILETTLKLLKKRDFDKIKVKDICKIVNTSEVTFFKYFVKKDEILQFFLQVWNYKRELNISKNGRQFGKDAIYKIFSDICETDQPTKIMLTIYNYISHLKERPKTLVLKDYEKYLIDNENRLEYILTLDDQIIKHLKEAKEDNIEEKAKLIGAIYYGTPLISHITREPLGELYIKNLDLLFSNKEN
ncbi:MAG: TetR/AcrR family transcriptional regulator [Spirochaetaceae bacterium]